MEDASASLPARVLAFRDRGGGRASASRRFENRRSAAADRPRSARVGGVRVWMARSARRISRAPSQSARTATPVRDVPRPAVSPLRSPWAAWEHEARNRVSSTKVSMRTGRLPWRRSPSSASRCVARATAEDATFFEMTQENPRYREGTVLRGRLRSRLRSVHPIPRSRHGSVLSPLRTGCSPAGALPCRSRRSEPAPRKGAGSRGRGAGRRGCSPVAAPRCRGPARREAGAVPTAEPRSSAAGRRPKSGPGRRSCRGRGPRARAATSGCRGAPRSPASRGRPRPWSRPSPSSRGDARRGSSQARCGCSGKHRLTVSRTSAIGCRVQRRSEKGGRFQIDDSRVHGDSRIHDSTASCESAGAGQAVRGPTRPRTETSLPIQGLPVWENRRHLDAHIRMPLGCWAACSRRPSGFLRAVNPTRPGGGISPSRSFRLRPIMERAPPVRRLRHPDPAQDPGFGGRRLHSSGCGDRVPHRYRVALIRRESEFLIRYP